MAVGLHASHHMGGICRCSSLATRSKSLHGGRGHSSGPTEIQVLSRAGGGRVLLRRMAGASRPFQDSSAACRSGTQAWLSLNPSQAAAPSPMRPRGRRCRSGRPQPRSSRRRTPRACRRRCRPFADGKCPRACPGQRSRVLRLAIGQGSAVAGVSRGFDVARSFLASGEPARNAGRDDQREEPPCPNPSC
jgi:hypothetical protein